MVQISVVYNIYLCNNARVSLAAVTVKRAQICHGPTRSISVPTRLLVDAIIVHESRIPCLG